MSQITVRLTDLLYYMALNAFPGSEPKDFQSIPLIGLHRTQQSQNGSLILGSLQKADAGWYMCRASNGVGSPLEEYIKVEAYGENS